jgi:hypothetical protein
MMNIITDKELNYYELEEFKGIYLEDSFVLDIKLNFESFEILLEAVLHETHPLYTIPLPNEQYCYRKARIIFSDYKKIVFHKNIIIPSVDASGEVDYGNIDTFVVRDGQNILTGDFGELEIRCDAVSLKID